MATAPPKNQKAAIDAFFKTRRRICFAIHRFGGKGSVKDVKAALDGVVLDDPRIRKTPISFLPADIDKEITTAYGRVEAVFDPLNNPHVRMCGVKAQRRIKLKNCDGFVIKWNEARDAYDEMADSVASRYDEIVAFNRDFWLPIFKGDESKFHARVMAKIPPEGHFRKRFWAKCWFEDVPTSGDTFSELVEEFIAEGIENKLFNAEMEIKNAVNCTVEYAVTLREFLLQLNTGDKITDKSLAKARAVGQQCLVDDDIIAPTVYVAIEKCDAVLAEAQATARELIEAKESATAYFKSRRYELASELEGVIALCEDKSLQGEILEKLGVAGPRPLAYDDEFEDID